MGEVKDALERIGLTADSADNYLALAGSALPAEDKVSALVHGLTDVRDRLRELYIELGGEDVWAT